MSSGLVGNGAVIPKSPWQKSCVMRPGFWGAAELGLGATLTLLALMATFFPERYNGEEAVAQAWGNSLQW